MTQHTTNDPTNKTKYCECGCGQILPKSKRPDRHCRFIHGHNARKRGTLADAFWAKMPKGNPDECWEWQGRKHPFGYGQFDYRGKHYTVHRASWEIHYGPIPSGIDVCHQCDNPPCGNPAHLFLGTRAMNVHDMIFKNRNARGKQYPQAKLSEADVIEIRRLASTGMLQKNIAQKYKVSRGTISEIINRKKWKHVP